MWQSVPSALARLGKVASSNLVAPTIFFNSSDARRRGQARARRGRKGSKGSVLVFRYFSPCAYLFLQPFHLPGWGALHAVHHLR